MIQSPDDKCIAWATRNMPTAGELMRAVFVVCLIWLVLILLWVMVVP